MSAVLDGDVLRSLRESRHWDQVTLAKRAGISPPVVSRLERGLQDDLDASVLVALAQSLGVPVDSLLIVDAQSVRPELIAELVSAVARLPHLSAAHQKQIAAILQGYLSALPE